MLLLRRRCWRRQSHCTTKGRRETILFILDWGRSIVLGWTRLKYNFRELVYGTLTCWSALPSKLAQCVTLRNVKCTSTMSNIPFMQQHEAVNGSDAAATGWSLTLWTEKRELQVRDSFRSRISSPINAVVDFCLVAMAVAKSACFCLSTHAWWDAKWIKAGSKKIYRAHLGTTDDTYLDLKDIPWRMKRLLTLWEYYY